MKNMSKIPKKSTFQTQFNKVKNLLKFPVRRSVGLWFGQFEQIQTT